MSRACRRPPRRRPCPKAIPPLRPPWMRCCSRLGFFAGGLPKPLRGRALRRTRREAKTQGRRHCGRNGRRSQEDSRKTRSRRFSRPDARIPFYSSPRSCSPTGARYYPAPDHYTRLHKALLPAIVHTRNEKRSLQSGPSASLFSISACSSFIVLVQFSKGPGTPKSRSSRRQRLLSKGRPREAGTAPSFSSALLLAASCSDFAEIHRGDHRCERRRNSSTLASIDKLTNGINVQFSSGVELKATVDGGPPDRFGMAASRPPLASPRLRLRLAPSRSTRFLDENGRRRIVMKDSSYEVNLSESSLDGDAGLHFFATGRRRPWPSENFVRPAQAGSGGRAREARRPGGQGARSF